MALTTAGFQGVVTESQEAGRFYRVAPPALADGTADMRVTNTTGTRAIRVATGTVQVCGVTVTNDALVTLNLNANSSSSARFDLVVLRVTWAGASSTVEILAKPGTSGGPPAPTRNPGSLYEFPLAVVRVGGSASSIAAGDVYDIRTYGGRGGRMRVLQESYVGWVDGHAGAEVIVEGTVRTYRKAPDGAWVLVSDILTPWRYFDPVLRYAGAGNIQAGVASLGTGGVRRGRFKVLDGFVVGEVEIRRGTTGFNFGAGDLTVDLPAGYWPDTYFADRWIHGHMYTTGETVMDWYADGLVKGGEGRALLYVTAAGNDARMRPARAQDGSNTVGKGIPYIATTHSDPAVICLNLCYSLGG